MKKLLGSSMLCAIVYLLSFGFSSPWAAQIKDSESATHGDDAAAYQAVDTYTFPGFKVLQFTLPVLSHYSYMLISDKQALVVDPGRDVFIYLDTAKQEGVKITGVFLTHSHADFVAGHVELAERAACPIYTSHASGAEYDFKPLREGSEITIGKAFLRFVETPGHTPDGLCAYVYTQGDNNGPALIFTGDTLFVGSVGRPDLMEGSMSAAALASMMYDTWNQKLSRAGDNAVIFPAHGAGSLCGAHLSDQPSSTIGSEKVANPYLRHPSRGEFVAAVLQDLPQAPQYFKHNAALNRKGPDLVDWHAPLKPVSADKALIDTERFYVVDLRDPRDYAGGHIPNAVNIGLRGRLETWVGTMVPWESRVALCGSEAELREAVYRLHRVGYRAQGITMQSWQGSGLPLSTSDLVKPAELYELMQTDEAPVVVDVRLPEEWMGVRIGTVVNLPLNRLAALASKLDTAMPTVTVCNSAYRSSLAVGILQRKGFQKVSSLAGGTEAWLDSGLPVYTAQATGSPQSAGRTAAIRRINLPERIPATALMRLMMDLPGTFEMVDIRPAEQFADYSLPGSTHVDIAELMNNPVYLAGVGPLIIVDRDGSLAMAVAGILSQKTERQIKALYGGVEAYWAESELTPAVRQVTLPGTLPKGMGPSAVKPGTSPNETSTVKKPIIPPASPAPEPHPPKKKSAGC